MFQWLKNTLNILQKKKKEVIFSNLVSSDTAAKELGISIRTLRRRIKEREIEGEKIGHKLFFKREHIEKIKESVTMKKGEKKAGKKCPTCGHKY